MFGLQTWSDSVFLVGEKGGWWIWAQKIISNYSFNKSGSPLVKPKKQIKKMKKQSWTRVTLRGIDLLTWIHQERETFLYYIRFQDYISYLE